MRTSKQWKNQRNRIISSLCIILLLMTTISWPATVVSAEEVKEEVKEGVKEGKVQEGISITASLQLSNEFVLEEQTFTLSGNEAEAYGYKDAEDGVTTLDALVAVHKELLGDDFTPDTANEYLSISNNSIERMYGIDSTAVSFAVNGYAPHNDVFNDDWKSYTGYMVTEAPLKNKDNVEFFFYQDTSYYMDNYSYFIQNDEKVKEITVNTDEPVDLKLKGYNFCYYSCGKPDFIEQMTQPIIGAQIMQKGPDANGSFEDLDGVVTQDSEAGEGITDGSFTVTFTQPGIFYLSAKTDIEDGDDPIVSPYCKVVVEQGNRAPSFKSGVQSEIKKELVVGQYCSIDLSELFEDQDGDSMTYYMAEDNGEYSRVWGYQTGYSPKTAGKHTVKFKAYDGKLYSPVIKYSFYVDEQSQITVSPTTESEQYIYQSPSVSSYHDYIWNSKTGNVLQFQASSSNTDETLTWSCSDGSGTIDQNGNLTLMKQNSEDVVVITVKGEDKVSEQTYFLNVKPAGMDFGKESLTMELSKDGSCADQSYDMGNYYYSGNIEITSSDESIAEVSIKNNTYTIHPNKPGDVTLTATWKADSLIKDTMTVHVTGVAIMEQGENDYIIKLGKNSGSIHLVAIGENEQDQFTWQSSDESVALVDENGTVTGKKEGSCIITAVSSATTLDHTIMGTRKIQVMNGEMHYLDSLSLGSYTSFGLTDENSFFTPSVREYVLKANSSYTSSINLKPVFSNDLGATAYYKDKNGNDMEIKLVSDEMNNLSNSLIAGDNTIMISVYPMNDINDATTYQFHVFIPCTTTNTITSMTIYPNEVASKTYPLYLGQKEGTLFKENGSTGFSSTEKNYVAYVFEGTENIMLNTRFGNEYEKVCIKVDDGNSIMVRSQMDTAPISLNPQGDTTICFYVLSSQSYYDAVKNGDKDPFQNTDNQYTLVIKHVAADAAEMKILNASILNGSFYAPGFQSDLFNYNILLPSQYDKTELTFQVPSGILVYKNDVTDSNLLDPSKQQVTDSQNASEYVCDIEQGKNLKICLKDPNSDSKYNYSFTCNKKGPDTIMPDEVTQYLCMASQYTNGGSFGFNPEKTLVKTSDLSDAVGGSVLSLGNYGGYITYKYNQPIVNDCKNPYGIDFMVYGNCNPGQSFSEPGNVEVSTNGEKWYTLAGSMHYEDEAFWNYKVTYTKNAAGTCNWSDNYGGKGILRFAYPKSENYPLAGWNNEDKSSVTLGSVKLVDDLNHIYDGAVAAYPDWGYADAHKNESVMGQAGNPYLGDEAAGSAFDLSWAVDENGLPVKLSEVSYIRISTASFVDAGMFGEKSTEVQTVARTINTQDAAVGITSAPSSIEIDGKDLELKEGVYQYEAKYVDDFTVKVKAEDHANIYINDERTDVRYYDEAPLKGIIRIVVQEAEKEPVIYYITLKSDTDQIEANKVIKKINDIKTVSKENAGLIYDARKAYNELSISGKKLVTNYATLTIAEEELSKLIDNPGSQNPSDEKPPVKEEPGKEDPGKDNPVKDNPVKDDTGTGTEQVITTVGAPVLQGKCVSYNSNELSWNQVVNARGYYIYRSNLKNKDYKLIAIVENESTFKDKGLTCGTSYYYKVKAFSYQNSGMIMSDISNRISIKVIPETVSITKAVSTKKNTISLKWGKTKGTSGYQIYRSRSLKGKYQLVKTTKGASYKDKKLVSKSSYYYKVRPYKTVNGKRIYGKYSEIKKVKAK